MLVLNEIKEDNQIVLSVEGKIDTLTSPELQGRILLCLQKMSNLVVDFEGVEYISSAGLRALLLGHKTAVSKGGYMKLIHLNELVLEVLNTTGFSTFLMIEDN